MATCNHGLEMADCALCRPFAVPAPPTRTEEPEPEKLTTERAEALLVEAMSGSAFWTIDGYELRTLLIRCAFLEAERERLQEARDAAWHFHGCVDCAQGPECFEGKQHVEKMEKWTR